MLLLLWPYAERGGIEGLLTIVVCSGYADVHGDAGRDEKNAGGEALRLKIQTSDRLWVGSPVATVTRLFSDLHISLPYVLQCAGSQRL